MRAGQLRHRLSLETPTEARDAYGGVTITWTFAGHVWCSIEPLQGDERMYAAQVNPDVTHRITMRYRDDVTPHCRLAVGDRIFNILSQPVNVDERNRTLIVMCQEEVE